MKIDRDIGQNKRMGSEKMEKWHSISLESVLDRISCSDDIELDRMLSAIERQYGRLFPEEEIVFLSMPRHNPQEQRRIMNIVLSFIEKEEQLQLGGPFTESGRRGIGPYR